MRPFRVLAIVAAMAGGARAYPVQQPVARYAPKGRPPTGKADEPSQLTETHYLYVATRMDPGAHSAGAGATIVQANPAIGVGDAHSLAEISVETADAKQIVELGWTIDTTVNSDLQPRLFVFHWVDGVQTCYNGCDWVQVSPHKQPGMRVIPGEAHRYEIKLVNNDWWMFYDGEGLGYFPQSIWGGRFKQAGLVQWFGEVAAGSTSPCTQMGNGKLGADLEATAYTGIHLFNQDESSVSAEVEMGALSNAALYNIGRLTRTAFGFGGPGAVTGCCTPATCAQVQADCGTLDDPVCAGNTLVCGACDTIVCTADHKCPDGVGPRDDGFAFDSPGEVGGGCCDGGGGSPGALALGGVVVLLLRRRAPR